MNHSICAEELYQAELEAKQVLPLTERFPNLTIKDTYNIQLENVKRKIMEGQKVIGMKVGLTSKAVQKMLGVNEPDYGHLTDKMLLREGEACDTSKLIQPKVEGELAFILKHTLKGPGVTIADVYNSTSYVMPAIEIVDSRVKDWRIKLEDTVADNGSSARFVLGGRPKEIKDIDLRLIGMTLEKNGELVASGTGAEVWGNPAAAVAWLANKMSEFGIELTAGSIVMSGSLTAMSVVCPGDNYTVSFYGMGSLSVKFI